MKITDQEFNRLVDYMYKKFGINLKQKRVLIEGRLNLMLTQRGYTSYGAYIDAVMKDKTGQEDSTLVSKLTTNFTYFLREEGHYDFMVKNIMPEWKQKTGGDIKIWSAASSSGEEPYSIAMVVSNFFGYGKPPARISIQASDISENVLSQARAGVYSADKIAKLPQGWSTRYFKKLPDGQFQVTDAIKAMVNYKYFNLNDNVGWQKNMFDVLFCRNVMIYFDQPTKQVLTQKLYDALKPGGYMFIGMSETLVNLQTNFVYVKPSVYMKKV
ncbi:protein-glutamate O-methyltransferase CheR [Christensenellaceae bacterium OttesenSCG-928-M15]|nr:protein-glutamate O-methyltransferase CheR [Christensenellaceae bacterium OttesenSCG-928-M15]